MRNWKTAQLKIAVIYSLIGGAWILLSDRLAAMMSHDAETLTRISTLKGWLFVVVTAGLLYGLVRRQMSALMERNGELAVVEEDLRDQVDQYHRAQTRLLEVNQTLQALFQASPLAIVALDPQGRVNQWNRTAEWLFGWTADEVVGKPYPLIPEDNHEEYRRFFQNTLQGEVLNDIETRRLKKSGEFLDVSVSTAPLRGNDGEISGIIVVLADITLRKQAMDAMQHSHRQYASLVDSIDGVVWELEVASFRFTFISRRVESVLGYTPPLWLSEPNFWQEHIHPDDREWALEFCARATEEKRDHELEYRFLAADGRTVWLRDIVTVIVEDDRPVALRGVMFDVTERKKVEEALKENEKLLRTVLETLPVGVWLMDGTGKLTMGNAAGRDIWGGARYVGMEEFGDYKGWWPDTGRRVEPGEWSAARAITRGETVIGEVVNIECFDGTRKTILDSAIPLRDGSGGISGAIVVNQDITERVKAEEALRQSEEKYRLLFMSNPHPMWLYDLETLAFLEVNEAAVKHYGYSREEFLSMTIKDIRPPEDVLALLDDVAKATTGYKNAGIWRHRKKDGTVLQVEITIHTIGFAGRRAEVVLVNDVTERIKAEEEIRRLNAELEQRVVARTAELEAVNEELQAIFSAFPDLFFRLDRNGVILDYKARAFSDLYAQPREFLGKGMQEMLPPLGGAAFQEALQRLREPGENGVAVFEYSLPVSGGEEFYEARLLPVFDDQIIAIVRNITARKRAEEEIRMLNEDLARRALQLEGANRELESFSYSVSHDLRAPLRHIEGFSKALVEDYSHILDTQGKMYLQRLRTATQRMGQLIDDLLKLSSVTNCELELKPVNLSRMAQIIALELKQTQPERRVRYIIAEDVMANGDARLLRVVLANLLGNAWKYTGKREEAVIEFGVTDAANSPAYYVRDNGAGFDMAYAGKLFGAFQRLHSMEDFEGTGIGLATVQRVIRRHGGNVWAEGEVGRGATFYFTLGEHSTGAGKIKEHLH